MSIDVEWVKGVHGIDSAKYLIPVVNKNIAQSESTRTGRSDSGSERLIGAISAGLGLLSAGMGFAKSISNFNDKRNDSKDYSLIIQLNNWSNAVITMNNHDIQAASSVGSAEPVGPFSSKEIQMYTTNTSPSSIQNDNDYNHVYLSLSAAFTDGSNTIQNTGIHFERHEYSEMAHGKPSFDMYSINGSGLISVGDSVNSKWNDAKSDGWASNVCYRARNTSTGDVVVVSMARTVGMSANIILDYAVHKAN
jgi:hypothetical protein